MSKGPKSKSQTLRNGKQNDTVAAGLIYRYILFERYKIRKQIFNKIIDHLLICTNRSAYLSIESDWSLPHVQELECRALVLSCEL